MRPCKMYRSEHKECKRWKGRFNQYFIYGEMLDCQGWADSYNNCQKYSWMEDKDAAIALIKSELERHEKRMQPHRDNDVWVKREQPPNDWNKPLPQFMIERNKGSYIDLQLKLNAMNESEKKKICTFM